MTCPPSDTPPPPPERLIVGRVLAPWGLKGHVKVENLSDNPTRFREGARYSIGEREYGCEEARRHGRNLVIRLEGFTTREEAAGLRGSLLEIPLGDAPSLPEGTYYHYQIIGLRVRTTDGRFLGEVVELLETGSNEVYVVRGPEGEVLIPAIADVVVALDLPGGQMTVEPLPGLF